MRWFKRLFQREQPPETKAEEKPKPKTWLEKMRDKFPHFRFVDTSLGGFNMPKYQRCPSQGCGVNCKRANKTMSGAHYRCRVHGDFLVKHPGV